MKIRHALLIAAACAALPATAAAEFFAELAVVPRQGGEPVAVDSGSIVRAGAQLKLRVRSDAAGQVSVVRAAGRSKDVVMRDTPIAARGSVAGPADLTVGTTAGPVALTVTFAAPGQAPQESRFDLLVLADTAVRSTPRPIAGAAAADTTDVAQLGDRPNLRILQRIGARAGEGAQRERGAVEIAVFRTAAPAVIMVSDGDSGLGSGVIIDRQQRLALTNHHVVGNRTTAFVAFKPARSPDSSNTPLIVADVIKVDEVADLALLRLRELPARVPELKLGDMGSLEVGADVHAIGHPTGELWTYTKGVVSQVRQGYEWAPDDGIQHQATVIQTQTPINPGNSGGPLLDDAGAILGINSFARARAQGINYAVSVDDIRAMLARPDSRHAAGHGGGKPRAGGPPDEGGGKKGGGPGAKGGKDGGKGGAPGKGDPFAGIPEFEGSAARGQGPAAQRPASGARDGASRAGARRIDADGNGTLDLWLLDENGDGEADCAARDGDGDGKPEHYRLISG
jgi:S1-C subfamily serine protease